MKRILMILDNAFKPDLRVKKEIETLIGLGNYIDLVCWDQDSDLETHEVFEGYSIHRIKLKTERQIGIKKISFLYKFFKKVHDYLGQSNSKYDIIYAHDFLMLPLGLYFKRKYKSKLVYDAHEIYHLMEWEKYPNIISHLIYAVERLLINKTDHFIVVSNYRKSFYSEKIKKDIHVIGNWYDEYDGGSIDLHDKLNLKRSKIILAYFGVLNFKVRPIDRIFDQISKSENLHLVVGGAGPDQDNIEGIIEQYKNISYLGWLENVREYMNGIDYLVYFMNSDRKYFYYTAPNSLYLAISHSKPLITNVEGEPKDLINNFRIGIFLKQFEDLVNINFNKYDDYKNMVLNINKIKNNYSWSNSFEVYQNIMNVKIKISEK